MTKHGIGSRVAVSLAFAALTAAMGCADLQGDDQQAVDEVVSQGEGESQVLEQTSGPLSGDNIKIESVSATGTGCPAGSWTADKVPEGNAFTLTFEKYGIDAPPTPNLSIKSLTCNINLSVKTPKNLSYAVTSFQYFGYANLAAGMKGNLIANYAFTGFGVAPAFKEFKYDLPVPHASTYAVNDDIAVRGIAPFWAPCNITSKLQVRTRITLEQGNRERPGLLSVDDIDVRAQAALRINFRTGSCPSVTRTQ